MKNIFTIFAIILSQVALCQTVEELKLKVDSLRNEKLDLLEEVYRQDLIINTINLDTSHINQIVQRQDLFYKFSQTMKHKFDSISALSSPNHEIGTLLLRNSKLKCSPSILNDTIDVDHVKISIKNGVVVHVHIFTKKEEVFETNKPITLNGINSRKDLITSKNAEVQKYVKLSDLLLYIPNDQTNYFFDNEITLTPNDSSKTLVKGSGINQSMDLRLYTDVLGTIRANNNATVLSEINAKLPIHNSNIGNSHFYLFKEVSLNFAISRFDDQYEHLPIKDFSRNRMYQFSWFNTKVNVSVGSLANYKNNNSYSLDFITGFNTTEVIHSDSNVTSHTLPFIGNQASIRINSSKNFRMHFNIPFYFQYGDELNRIEQDAGIEFIAAPEVEAVWHPKGNKFSSFFGRCRLVSMKGGGYDFFMAHFGYNLSLSDFISGSKK